MTDWVSHFRKKKVQLHINVRKDLLFFIYPSKIRIFVLRISESRFDLVQTFGLISSLKGVFVKYERVSWLMAKNNRFRLLLILLLSVALQGVRLITIKSAYFSP